MVIVIRHPASVLPSTQPLLHMPSSLQVKTTLALTCHFVLHGV